MNKKILELLYRSFDETLSKTEQLQLEDALAKSKKLQEEKEQIAQMRTMIFDSSQKSFHPFFAEKVMNRIREQERSAESFFDSLIYAFRPVIIAATILLAVLSSYNVMKSDSITLASAFAEPEIRLEHALDPTLSLVME